MNGIKHGCYVQLFIMRVDGCHVSRKELRRIMKGGSLTRTKTQSRVGVILPYINGASAGSEAGLGDPDLEARISGRGRST